MLSTFANLRSNRHPLLTRRVPTVKVTVTQLRTRRVIPLSRRLPLNRVQGTFKVRNSNCTYTRPKTVRNYRALFVGTIVRTLFLGTKNQLFCLRPPDGTLHQVEVAQHRLNTKSVRLAVLTRGQMTRVRIVRCLRQVNTIPSVNRFVAGDRHVFHHEASVNTIRL